MDDLPGDVLQNILLKLPAQSILRFRAVSKHWLEIIDKPSFRSSFEAQECMVLGISLRHPLRTIYSMVADGHSVEAKSIVCVEGLQSYFFKNCCHGLFYFEKLDQSVRNRGVVVNPLTREVLRLPNWHRWSLYGIIAAIGFDPLNDTFKIVELFFEDSEKQKLGAATFNLKTRRWVRLKGPQCPSAQVVPHIVHATDAGTLYWHVGRDCVYDSSIDTPKRWPDGSRGQLIFSFDVGKEEFRSIWFPKRIHSMHITELDGRLTLCSYGVKYINLYELADYQSQDWVTRYRIQKPPPCGSVDLSSFSKNKILITYPSSVREYQKRKFDLYDFDDDKMTSLGEGRFHISIRVYCVKPSLISLK